mmetsp:Transcript_3319/g.5826  ORF Transcript_3319/g.5826 Transcript_3319/m.5826 type:complete len:363 (-) Transcript_3319:456-1544(-)|eukprot:CAMPEP_0182450740 /NCGR_PEP_ID=MMETSP1172-20130603/43343_1 /TAXON_ID=708627 /ORGANISM="Timspurckia oligopyrenoides, Strain CCMP3278" /LENGTH=362 /DNA_ID=CAMNT_0024648459 /DNA_START=16 /DNA_END=1104 /DNA_ORIENTATION=+
MEESENRFVMLRSIGGGTLDVSSLMLASSTSNKKRRRPSHSALKSDFFIICQQILAELNKADVFKIFAEPVSIEDVPDYLSVIKNPMDLGTVEKKLLKNEYNSFMHFHNDLELIWSNCLTYNMPLSPFSRAARKLKKLMDRLFSEFGIRLMDENDEDRSSESSESEEESEKSQEEEHDRNEAEQEINELHEKEKRKVPFGIELSSEMELDLILKNIQAEIEFKMNTMKGSKESMFIESCSSSAKSILESILSKNSRECGIQTEDVSGKRRKMEKYEGRNEELKRIGELLDVIRHLVLISDRYYESEMDFDTMESSIEAMCMNVRYRLCKFIEDSTTPNQMITQNGLIHTIEHFLRLIQNQTK